MDWVLVHGALLIAMIQRLHGYDYGSKVTLYGSLETFLNHPIGHIAHDTSQGPMETSVIQKDEYIPGNILTAMGSALFSVNKDGYGDCTCPTSCSDWSGCINNTFSEPFRYIAGVAQLNSGEVLIISDRGNRCLRRLDRRTQIITAYAGQCNESYDDTLDDKSDTSVDMDVVRFCALGTLQYVRSLEQIVVLDTCKTTSNIYTVNIINSRIYKIYSTNRTVTGFVYEPVRNTLTLLIHSDHGQVVEVNLNTKAEVSMAGNPQEGSGGDGKISTLNSLLHIDSPRQIALEKGLYIVSDSNRDSNTSDIYMFDTVNDKFASLCVDYQECNLIRPVAVAVIDDYLYIGESVAMKVEELHNRTYFYYYYHRIYRVGIQITENYRNPVVDPQCRHGCWTEDWFRWDFNMADFTTTQVPSSTTGPGRDNKTHNYVYWIIFGVFILTAGVTTVAIVFSYKTGRMCFKKKNSGSFDQTMLGGNPYTRMSDI